jgi:hypothetical protein
MRLHACLSLLLAFALACSASSQSNQGKQQQKQKKDDLPDVALVIPEETRPEVKAILKSNAVSLVTGKSAERAKAAVTLGELGEQGKPVRGLLCRAMLDPVPSVRVAAADALKLIDAKTQYLAVGLVTAQTSPERLRLFGQIRKLEADGEPLAPLVAHYTVVEAGERAPYPGVVEEGVGALSSIGRNDVLSCRLLVTALDNKNPLVRRAAMQTIGNMKHGKLAVKKILALLTVEGAENRVAAIQALAALADASDEEMIAEAVAAQRYHPQENVRQAVEVALNKMKDKSKKDK